MARIRSIKPEFWTSAQILECSTNARLLFIGMWNFCDDTGRHPDSAKQLKAEIFPADDFSVENILGMVSELEKNGLITRYVVDNTNLIQVNGWNHQRIDKPQKSKYPPVPDNHSENIPGTFPPDRIGKDRIGEEGIGRDRKGGDGKTLSGTPDRCGAQKNKSAEAKDLLDYLNEKTGKSFKHVESNFKPIRARISEGVTVDELRRVVDRKCAEWMDTKMSEYLRPATLFNFTKCHQYLGELSKPSEEEEAEQRVQDWLGESGDVIEGEVEP